MPAELSDWYISTAGDSYTAPERRAPIVVGVVRNHPRQPDGKKIQTTPILRVEGRRFWTANTEYVLVGPPLPAYEDYRRSMRLPPTDPDHPIKFKGE